MSPGQHSFAGSFALPNRAFYHSLWGALVWQFPWCGAWSRVSTRSLVGTRHALEDGGGSSRLTGFWARHVELSLAEQMRLLAWHGDCQRALADQLGLPSNVTAELPLAFPSAQERPEGGCCRGAAGSESLAARLEKLPPLPDLDQPAEQWLARERLSDLPGALNGGRVGSETPRSLTSDSESLDGRGVPFAAGVTGSITVDGSAVILGDRYRLDRLLGEGNYGRVWLGFDRELRRQVAIKVPLPGRFQTAADAELYRSEARTVASLPHHAPGASA